MINRGDFMKALLVLVSLFVIQNAQATPGDIGCDGVIGKNKISILIGRVAGGTFDVAELSVNSKVVAKFEAAAISAGQVNVFKEKNGKLMSKDYFSVVGPAGLIYIRMYQPNAEGEAAYLTINVPSEGLKGLNIPVTCQL
jgi:hypothetical protein